MYVEIISVFALALAVVANGVLVSTTYALRRQVQAQESRNATFEKRFVNVSIKLGELHKASPAHLAAEVAALDAAVARLRATHQRFAGRFDQYVGSRRPVDDDAHIGNGAPADDDEFSAMLALQQAGGGQREGS